MLLVAPNAYERENILPKPDFIGPVRRAGAVRGNFSGCAASIILWTPAFAPSPSTPPALCPQGSREERKEQHQQAEFFHGLLSRAGDPPVSFAPCKSPLISNSSRCASR